MGPLFGPARPPAVAVLLPLPLPGPYDYTVPDGVDPPAIGSFVRVPLGRRTEIGVVWGPAEGGVDPRRLRSLAAILPVSPLPEISCRFVDWVAAYTVSPPGLVLKMAMSVPAALESAPSPRLGWCLADRDSAAAGVGDSPRITDARQRVLTAAAATPGLSLAELARAARTGPAVVRGLIGAGCLVSVALPSSPPAPSPDPERPAPVLSTSQAAAAESLCAAVRAGRFSVTLLDGVTGSGKTEVYFEALADALRQGHQVLVLLPEIALTAQWLGRFERRFGVRPLGWHSDLTPAVRRDTWRAVLDGRARVIVGARSALFLPFRDLGLIIVDEEHDSAFKQEDGVLYHARDMAVVRGLLGELPVILASATPALETMANVTSGRYARVVLSERHGQAAMAAIAAIDLRQTPPERGPWGQSWLAPPLVVAIRETLAAGEQGMLFLNRRGYAPLTLCRACGYRFRCPHCSAWLVDHRATGVLCCHHCDHSVPLPSLCPGCGVVGRLAPCGPGVERIAEELTHRYPSARVVQVTGDTLSGPVAVAAMVDRVLRGEVDLLVGTQVLAKGHHFPRLTLVGVVDADLGLAGGDLRAAERTFQVLAQVSGRAGRADRPGRVLVQTCDPTHPVLDALVSGDRDGFLAAEATQRREAGMPPFGRLVGVIVSGTNSDQVSAVAADLARTAPFGPGVVVLGPAAAPLAMLRDRHRRRLLLKADRSVRVQPLVTSWLAGVRIPSGVRVQMDVDPYSFL